MSARRRGASFVLVSLRRHRAERRWATLALHAGIACDDRLCAKLAKVRKQAPRTERRVVRQLLRIGVTA